MEKKVFYLWLLIAMLFSGNMNAQANIGSKKIPEDFSVLELTSTKGGLRLPQLTTAQRNALAVSGKTLANGLTIYNTTTTCMEYWDSAKWVSLCDGASQTVISPAACLDIAADGTGCNSEFKVSDVDCPVGPFNIAIVAGGDYASLYDVDNTNGSFKIAFNENATINVHTVLVRVTSTCTSMYKDFLFSQNGVTCSNIATPTVTPSTAALSLCSNGSVYLSVPKTTANLNNLIWTRNGVEVARGVSSYTANQPGKYNISMGAVGCNVSTANERVITASATTAPSAITAIASNDGVICGTNSVTLTAAGSTTNVVWMHDGVEEKTGATITLTGDSSVGEWFAAIKEGSCYSKPSNVLIISKGTATGMVTVSDADVLVNGKRLDSFTSFCAGGSLDLSVANPKDGVSYTWYNGNTMINTNPFLVPTSQAKLTLRMIASDNTGKLCSKEVSLSEKNIETGTAPAQPNIKGNATLCDGTTDLTLVPAVAGTYTYAWYKDGVKMPNTTATIAVTTPGIVYTGTVTNSTGCVSPIATKVISANISSLPVLSWISKPASGTFGAKVTVQTGIEFGPATSYTWTATNGAVVTGSGASVSIQLPASDKDGSGKIDVKVIAENSCGKSTELTASIGIKSDCPTPVVSAQASLSQSVAAGSEAVVSVSATGLVGPSYQWYTNNIAAATGGTAISGAGSASCSYIPTVAGTYYLYAIVSNNCGTKAASPVFTIIATVNPTDLEAGTGTLNGKTCFDIAESNDNTSCGGLATRSTTKADFNLASVNTQTYTFTPSGTVSKVRFAYVESLGGEIVKTITNNGDETATNISGAVTATIVYKSTLSTGAAGTGTAYGKTRDNSLNVDIYAIYNDKADGSGTDKQVKLTAQIKDCACCGAYTAPGVFREFMCYNLGANTSYDPMVPDPEIVGDFYDYGQKTPYFKAAKPAFPFASPVGPSDQREPNDWGGSSGIKTNFDPCPAGYRVPTVAEWNGLAANNKFTKVGAIKSGVTGGSTYVGTMVGSTLMLPGTGFYGYLNDVIVMTTYVYKDSVDYAGLYRLADSRYYIGLTGEKGYVRNASSIVGAFAAPVRCISQK